MANHNVTITLTEVQQQILSNDLYNDSDNAGLDAWVQGAMNGKINNCWKRMQREWTQKLMDDSSFTDTIPSNQTDFVNLVLNELDIKFKWKGKGLKEKCYDKNGNCIVACSQEYFRPLEVDTLLGNARKAKKELNWKPKTSIKKLVKEMVNFDLRKLING